MDKLIRQNINGFSTLELLIAMTILTMVLSAVVVVSFGNQSFLVGGQLNSEAMNKAQALIEQEQALGRKDFNLVNATSTFEKESGGFTWYKSVSSTLMPDLLTKQVSATIQWGNVHNATSTLEVTTLIANFDTPVGGNTCDSTPIGNWQLPTIANPATADFATLVHDAGQKYTLSDVDAYRGKVYVTASAVSGPTKPTLFIFDAQSLVSDPAHALLGSIDNEGTGGTVGSGLNAVTIAEDPASSPVKRFAYAANAHPADYTSCNPATKHNCGELDIFDVTDDANPQFKTNLMIASSTAPAVTGIWAGNSIYYRNGYVLLGLAKSGGSGPEFYLIDMHNVNALLPTFALSKNIVLPVGSFTVGNDVNALAMRNSFIYMATPNSARELTIASTTNPNAPTLAGWYGQGTGNGKSMALVGDRLYLGRTTAAGDDLEILNITNPASAPTDLQKLGGVDVGDSVNGIVQRDFLTFALTNAALKIYRTDTPAAISLWGSVALPAHSLSPVPESSIDCEANTIYITSNDSAGNGFLYVVQSS